MLTTYITSHSHQTRGRCRPVGSPPRRLLLPTLHDRWRRPDHALKQPRSVGRNEHRRVHSTIGIHERVGAGAALHPGRVLHLRRDGEGRQQRGAPDVRAQGQEHHGPHAAIRRTCLLSSMFTCVRRLTRAVQLVGQIGTPDNNWAIDGTVLIVSRPPTHI